MMAILVATSFSSAGIAPLNLLSLDNFVIVAGSTITGIPPVTITGNVGLSPAAGSYITGFDGTNIVGTLYVVDASGPVGSVIDAARLTTAKNDLTTAYTDAANRTPVPTGTFLNPGAGNIGGMNLAAGLYKFTGAADITGADVTLTGGATDVWIFQIGTSLNLGSGIKIILAGGAQAANIFWQVGTSATLGTYSVFKGTILADQSISLGTGASMEGRALAFSAAVTMSSGVTSNKAFLFPVFSADSIQVRFGNVGNLSSKTDTVRVTNTGGADLIISNVTSSNSRFTISSNTATITPGSTQNFYITFAPLANGSQSGNIIFTHNAPKPKDTITVSGTGVSPFFSANKLSVNFGNVRNNTTKLDSVTVTNTGTANLIITSVTSSNTVFTISATTATIKPDSAQKFYITFAPLVDGSQSGNIIFNHNALKPKDTITVSGTGVSPLFLSTRTTLNFGNVRNNTTKLDSVTISNPGTANLVITSVTSSNSSFTFSSITGTITPGSSQKFYILFAPLVDGLQSGNIIFTHNALKPKDTITVSGTGVSPLFSVTPTTLNFGNVRNNTMKRDSVTVSNPGTSDLIITNVTSSNALFTISATSGTITPGSTQKFYITFAPLVDGLQSGNITFTHNALVPTNIVTVSGTGVSPLFTVTPTTLNFGNVRNNTTKRDSVTVSNPGTTDLIITGVTSSNPLFTISATTGTITPGSTQKFYITFAPLVDGLQSGNITFTHNASVPTNIVTVSGTGVSPLFSVTPTTLNFGNVRNNTTKRDSVTVTNPGTTDLVITGVTSSNPLFTISATTGTITPGSTQKFYITFAPLVDGLQSGNITFTHNASVPTNIVTVSGTGVSPLFSVIPTTLNFGNVRNNTTKLDSITVSNPGTTDLIITNVTSSNPLFTVSATSGIITPGLTQKFYITFAPLVDGLQTGNITFTHNGLVPTSIVTVSGTGVSPAFSVINGIQFGNVRTGLSKQASITVTNTGTSDLIIYNVTIFNKVFTVTPTNGTIAPGLSKSFFVTFAPIVDGFQSDYVYFNHNADNLTNLVSVTGTGVTPKFSVNRVSLNFGSVRNGTSKVDSVIVTNIGTDDLVISSVTSTNSLFTYSSSIGTIAPGAWKKFYITFSPVVDGFQSGTINFTHNGISGIDFVSVTGTGVSTDTAPKFSVDIANLDFGDVFIGSTKQKSVTVTNSGVTNLVISSIISNDTRYTITPLVGTIAPGASKQYFITFAPTVIGRANAVVTFNHNDGSNVINVTGNGIDTMRIITIKAARDLPIGTQFITQGVITRILGSYTRIQDATGGLTILQESGVFYNEVQFSGLQMGDSIRIEGRISEKNYLKVVEGDNLVNHFRLSRMNPLPAPIKVTLAEIARNGEQYESCLIHVDNLTITSDDDRTFQEAKTYQVRDASDRTNTVVVRIGNKADTYTDGMPLMGTSATFEGVLSQSSTCDSCGYQLTPVLATDLRTEPNGVFDAGIASQNTLLNNYPNPFNASTTIHYTIPSADFVTLKVFNVSGQEISTLVNSFQSAGTYSVVFSAQSNTGVMTNSEMYFYRLEVGKVVSAKQMILVK